MNQEAIKKQLLKEIRQLKSKEGFLYAGLPHMKGLFGRDSLISAWQLLDYDPKIAKDTLKILAKAQGKKIDLETEEEPGKILHEFYPKNTPDSWWNKHRARFKWLKRGKAIYKSIDSTLLFIIIAGKYFDKTKDFDFVKKIFPNIERAISWIFKYGDMDGDGFIEYEKKAKLGMYHMAWKDREENHLNIDAPVAIVEVQGYAYLAFTEAAKLAKIFGKSALEKKLLSKAQYLKKKFNEKFWMRREKYFCMALNGKKNQRKAITSNPGHLLFTGILEQDKIDLVVKHLFASDMWTPYGIRTHSEKEPDFDAKSYHLGSIWPHDNWIIAQGLNDLGYNNEYKKIKKALLLAFENLGLVPELYIVINNKIAMKGEDKIAYPQAWATGALFSFLEDKNDIHHSRNIKLSKRE
ncbi:hypothetical protein KKG29_01260 [Patescibacteria group bacterium]|nr:hypothetical protein [Patescibacteria group bacterium]MBU3999792.1 hypothetical protein [Patescibacteria group bacterium]MBU4056961.1 hypothetical protein [Patescibacteria group bacterium]MBU4368739.1 hypothetical protein [Patescibacteria group bacterium]